MSVRTVNPTGSALDASDPYWRSHDDFQNKVGATADEIATMFPSDYFASELRLDGPRFFFKGVAPRGALDLIGRLPWRGSVVEHVGLSFEEMIAGQHVFEGGPTVRGTCFADPPHPNLLLWKVHCRRQSDVQRVRTFAESSLPALPVTIDAHIPTATAG